MFEYNCLLYYSVNICDSTPCKNGGKCIFNSFLIMCFECKQSKSKRSWRNYSCKCLFCLSSNSCFALVQINVFLSSNASCVTFKCMLSLLSNWCCAWIQYHVVLDYNIMLCLTTIPCCVWLQYHVVFEFKYILCLHLNSYCAWIQIDLVFEFKVMLYENANLCCIWVQILNNIWIQSVVFELKFMLCWV